VKVDLSVFQRPALLAMHAKTIAIVIAMHFFCNNFTLLFSVQIQNRIQQSSFV